MLLLFLDIDATIAANFGKGVVPSERQLASAKSFHVDRGGIKEEWTPPSFVSSATLYWVMHQKLFRFTAENNDHCKIIFLTMGDYSREQVNESAQLLMNHHRSRAPHLVTDLSGGTGFDVINRTILYSMEQNDSSIRQATFKNYGPPLGKRPVDDRNGILKRIGVERYLAAYAVGSDKNEVIVIDDSKRVREQVNLINRKCVSKLDIYDPQAEDYQMQLAYIGCRILYYQRAALKAEHEATTGSGSPKLMKPGDM